MANCTVLHSRKSSTWKITDFGISAEGTTNYACTTKDSKGSIGYRAPELLALESNDKAVYTNKVDIWSMGCILYELAAGQKAFRNDLDVYDYRRNGKELWSWTTPSMRYPFLALRRLLSLYYRLALHRGPHHLICWQSSFAILNQYMSSHSMFRLIAVMGLVRPRLRNWTCPRIDSVQ